jgi:dephospho-CoA kinase
LNKRDKSLAIGLTGGPGVGKSEVAKILSGHKFKVINADHIGHELLAGNSNIKSRLVKLLSRRIVASDGLLDRRAIGEVVFSDSNLMSEFNRIIHPALLKELKRRMTAAGNTGSRGVVVDAALIYEWGIADWFDFIVAVNARREKRLQRMQKQGLSLTQVSRRIASQIPQRDKIALADFVINNNSTLAVLNKEVNKTILKIESALAGINQ